MATPSESRLGASPNGELADRVKQLRLDNQLGAGAPRGPSRSSLLPWILCGMLAVTWAGIGVRWYKAPAQKAEETAAPAAPEDVRAYEAARAKLRQAEEGLKRLQADLAEKKPDATPEKVKELTEQVAKLKREMPANPQATEAGAVVTQLKGIVIPSLQVTVSPRDVAAEITDIFFYEGKRVRKDEVLATLLNHQYANRFETDKAAVAAAQAQLARATASKASAAAMVARAEAALAASKARVTRAVAYQARARSDYDLAERQYSAGTIASQEYQKFKADNLGAEADLDAAKADVTAAEKSVAAAKEDVNTATAAALAAEEDVKAATWRRDESNRLVGNCVVKAPIEGTILTKSADKGALVSPMSFNVAAGICTLADLSKLEVEIDVPERLVTKIKPGQACKLQADADTNRPYRGVVDRVMPIADDTKNVVKVRIRAYLPRTEEPGAFLKPKMSVTATVYERLFELDSQGDYLWGDEDKRQPDWAKGWKK